MTLYEANREGGASSARGEEGALGPIKGAFR